jgi:hypothetical protein
VRSSLYLAYADSVRGVTDGRHKLIEYACGATQLFDLVDDPLEMRNLANREASRPVLAGMRQDLVDHARDWDDERHPTGKAFWQARSELK